MSITNRKDAKIAGSLLYFTGKSCARGHVSERYTSTGQCVQCAREDRGPAKISKIRSATDIDEIERRYAADLAAAEQSLANAPQIAQAHFDSAILELRQEYAVKHARLDEDLAARISARTRQHEMALESIKRPLALRIQNLKDSRDMMLRFAHDEVARQEARVQQSHAVAARLDKQKQERDAREDFKRIMKRIRVTIAPAHIGDAESVVYLAAAMRCVTIDKATVCKGTDPVYPLEVYYVHPEDMTSVIETLKQYAPAVDISALPVAPADWKQYE